ncbi:hypothetical protein CCACVL1_05416 [Corchorus capsularis]|uniref:Uncharacterized protein n=1 Tax=Corchorus capsularis TaxID=210143 RepID=A0A1R3JKT8_COCAP|nr:hypothetical protein CCACVL1_05416 [Corchorus capsularis]
MAAAFHASLADAFTKLGTQHMACLLLDNCPCTVFIIHVGP